MASAVAGSSTNTTAGVSTGWLQHIVDVVQNAHTEQARPARGDIAYSCPNELLACCAFWAAVWLAVLSVPPGRTSRANIYNLHAGHGMIGPLLAVGNIAGVVPFDACVSCTLAYFGVDVLNMLNNDFVLKDPGYQKPLNRAVEYLHHFIVLPSVCVCAAVRDTSCSFGNPLIPLIINEASTPFLIMFRVRRKSPWAGPLFVVIFFLIRIVANTLYFAPLIYNGCNHDVVWWPQAFPFFLIQWYFFFQIIQAIVVGGAGGTPVARNLLRSADTPQSPRLADLDKDK